MSKKKEEAVLFNSDDPRAVIMGWLKDSTSNPEEYITREGMAYLNGFLQTNRTMSLIKKEKYSDLLEKFDMLLSKYEDLKDENKELKSKILPLKDRVINLFKYDS